MREKLTGPMFSATILSAIVHEFRLPSGNFRRYLETIKGKKTAGNQDEILKLISNYFSVCDNYSETILNWVDLQLGGAADIRQSVLPRLQVDLVIISVKLLSCGKQITVKNNVKDVGQLRLNLPVFEYAMRTLLLRALEFAHSSCVEVNCSYEEDSLVINLRNDISRCNLGSRAGKGFFGSVSSSIGWDSGLDLCNSILKDYGGMLWVERWNRFPSFYFRMPVAR